MIRKVTTRLAAVAVADRAALGLATPSLAREILGSYSKSELNKMVLKNNGTVKTTSKTTELGGRPTRQRPKPRRKRGSQL